MTSQAPTVDQYARFYSKFSQISNDVAAGVHARFNIPLPERKRLEPLYPQVVSPPAQVSTSADSGQVQPEPVSPPRDTQQVQQVQKTLSVPPSASSQPHAISKNDQASGSGFPPFLLEKSPALIQAESEAKRQRENGEQERQEREIKNKRQRLEKKLKDAYDKSINPDLHLALRSWDGPNILDAAQLEERAVAAVEGDTLVSSHLDTNHAASPQSSFDENSYYSSQVNEDWPSGSDNGSEPGEVISEADAIGATDKQPQQNGITPVISQGPANRTVPNQQTRNGALPVKPSQTNSQRADPSAQLGYDKPVSRGRRGGRDDSYSPPSPGAFRKPGSGNEAAPRGSRAMHTSPQRGRPRRAEKRPRESESYSPPSPALPLIRDYRDRTPIYNRNPRANGTQQQTYTGGQDEAYSNKAQLAPPDAGSNNVHKLSRKARRLEAWKLREERQNNGFERPLPGTQNDSQRDQRGPDRSNRATVYDNGRKRRHSQLSRAKSVSPEPYIKQEPVSPPPLNSLNGKTYSAPQKLRRVHSYASDMDDIQEISPREAGFSRSVRGQGAQEIAYQAQRPGRNVTLDPHRPTSANALVRRPRERDLDYRRVASLQHAGQSLPDQGYARAGAYDDVYSARPHPPPPQTYSDGYTYAPIRYTQAPPPPKKRVIIMPNGERWVATREPSEAPRSMSHMQPTYDPYAHVPPRARVIELDDDDDLGRMPPPPSRPLNARPPAPPIARQQTVDDHLERALSLGPQETSRAASMQQYPRGTSGYGDMYAHAAMTRGFEPYSARPDIVAPQPYPYERRPRYEIL